MITDTEIKQKGVQILSQYLGDVEAERFIALIQREPFDYTKWHQNMDDDMSRGLVVKGRYDPDDVLP